MADIDMSKDFAEARARGEAALLREEIASLRTRLAVAEAERDEQTEHADTLKRSDRQSLADYRKLRAQLDAAVERAEQAEAERDELRRRQTEPDESDPDGWIRRSALNHWHARAIKAEAEVARLQGEWAIIDQQERDCIRRDVAEALSDGRKLGWQCDHDEWAALAAWMDERKDGGT